MNQVTIVGRLTKHPELRKTNNGKTFVYATLAVKRHYRNSNGEYETDFISCALWDKVAEAVSNRCVKGTLIGVSGRIQTRTYEGEDGNRKYVTEVVAQNVSYLEKKRETPQLPF